MGADRRIPRSSHPSMSAFPDSTIGAACTSTFSRFARRSLTLRPAHSRVTVFRDRYPAASDISSAPCLPRLLPAGANRRVGLAPTGKRRLITAHVESGYSITSSARARIKGGRVRLRAFAVFILTTSSNLVGRTKGKSAGFSPLRIRPV